MLKHLLFIIFTIILASCNQSSPIYESKDVSMHSSNLIKKSGQLKKMAEDVTIHPIDSNVYSFFSVYEWYDDNTILYLSDENGSSLLSKFNILTGESELFYQKEDPIIRVETSPSHSYFVVEVATFSGLKQLDFVNNKGSIIFRLDNLGEQFQLFWNPYNESELIIAVLNSDFSVNMYLVDLLNGKTNDFDFEYFYVQWVDDNVLAYLKWDQFNPSYFAPLYSFDLKKQVETKLAENVIAFFSFTNHFMTISVEDNAATHSMYTFFDRKMKAPLAKVKVPILNTYSEQWWIPFQDYHFDTNSFYFMEPVMSGDLYDYSEGFRLMSFHLQSGVKKEIVQVEENFPLKISNNGRWLLYGHRLENIIDLKNNQVFSLLNWP